MQKITSTKIQLLMRNKNAGFINIQSLLILLIFGLLSLLVISILEDDSIPVEVLSKHYDCVDGVCKIKFHLVSHSQNTEKLLVNIKVYFENSQTDRSIHEGMMLVQLHPKADNYYYHTFPYRVRPKDIEISLQRTQNKK